MEGGDEGDRAAEENATVYPSPDLCDPIELDVEAGEDVPARVPAKSHDHLRPYGPDLFLEIWAACADLLWPGVTVPRRPVLDDVRDKDRFPRETDPGKEVVEKPSSPADERPPGKVFLFSRGFADEHEISPGIPFSRNRMMSILPEGASPAFGDCGGKPLYRCRPPSILYHAHTIEGNSYNLLMDCVLAPDFILCPRRIDH